MSALKRVAQLVAGATPVASAVIKVQYADLRVVLALAKRAGELKRRIRLARAAARGQMVSTSLWELLDLRKPLPKSRRRWNVEIAAAMKLEAELRRSR